MIFCFNDTATTEIYTLSLHDALPISGGLSLRRTLRVGEAPRPRRGQSPSGTVHQRLRRSPPASRRQTAGKPGRRRSEEHTSELQSRQYLVCRLLLEKKTD